MQALRQRTGPFILLALCLTLCSQQTPAQAPTGVLGGRVLDQLGGLIAGADITVTAADGAKRTTVTNSEGSFAVAGLAPGRYLVRAAARSSSPLSGARTGRSSASSPTRRQTST